MQKAIVINHRHHRQQWAQHPFMSDICN